MTKIKIESGNKAELLGMRSDAAPDPYATCWPSCGTPDGNISQLKEIRRLFWIHLGGYVVPGFVLTLIILILSVSFSALSLFTTPSVATRSERPLDLSPTGIALFVIFMIVVPIALWICGAYCCEMARRLARTITFGAHREVADLALSVAYHPVTPQQINSLNQGQFLSFWVNFALSMLRVFFSEKLFISASLGAASLACWVIHTVCYYMLLTKMRTYFIITFGPSSPSLEEDNTVGIPDDRTPDYYSKEPIDHPSDNDPNADHNPFITYEAADNGPFPQPPKNFFEDN